LNNAPQLILLLYRLESSSGYYFDIAYAKELFVASDFETLKKYLRGFLSVDHGSDHQIILFDILKEYFFESIHRKEHGIALTLLKEDFAFIKSEPIYKSLKQILVKGIKQDLDKIDDNLKSWRDTSKYREALWNQKIEKGLLRVLADQIRPINVPEGRLKTLLNQSLNYQHSLCKLKSDAPQNYIWTLFEDHRCGYKAPEDNPNARKINGVGHKPEVVASSSSAASKEEASEKSVDKSETKRVEPSPQQRAVQQEKITPSTVNNSANNTPAAQSTKTNGVSPNSSSGTVATPTVTNKMKRSATTPVDDGPKKKKARVSKVEEDEDEVLPLHLLTTIKFRDCKVVAAKFHPKHDHIVVVCINSMSGGAITLIDLKVGHEYCAVHKIPIEALEFSKDGRFFAVSYVDSNTIELFRFKSENEFTEAKIITHDSVVGKFAFIDAYLTDSDNKDDEFKITRKGHKTLVVSADAEGNAFGWDAVTGKMEVKYQIPEGHTITAIGEFMHRQEGSEYQFLLLGSKHNVAFCCRPLSSDLAVGDPLGLPSENGVCDFATLNNRVFSVGVGPRSLVEWDYTSSDMKKAEFKEFRKTTSNPVTMSVYQNLLVAPDDKVVKFWQITDYRVIARVSEELTQNKLILAVNFNKLGQLLAAVLEGDSVVILANSEAQTHFKIAINLTFDDSGRVDSGKRRSSTSIPPPVASKKVNAADSTRRNNGKLASQDDEMLVDSGDETQGNDEMEVEKPTSQQSQSRLQQSQGSQGAASIPKTTPKSSPTPTKVVPVQPASTPTQTPTPTPTPAPVVPRVIPVRSYRKLLLPDAPTAAIRAVKFNWNENMLFAMAGNGHHRVWYLPSEKLTLESQPGFSFFEDPSLRCNAEYPALAITNSDAFTLTNAEGDLRLLQVKDKKTLGFKARLYTPPADFGLTVFAMCPQDNNLLMLGSKKGDLYRFNSHVKPELKTAKLSDGVQTSEITAIAFAPIYKLSSFYALAGSKDGKVSAWRMVKENDMYEFKRHTQSQLDGEGDVRIAVFTPPVVVGEAKQLDETRVLLVRSNYLVIVKRDLTPVANYKHKDDLAPIQFAAWSAQGTYIYLCLRDDNIVVLNTKTMAIHRIVTLHDDFISDITCMTASLYNNNMICVGTASGKTLLVDLLN
jgi:WD40 repeat protein